MSSPAAAHSRVSRSLPLLGAFVVGAIAYAPLYCFPVMSQAFGSEFGTSRSLTVLPWTVFLLVSALLSPLLGRAYDVFRDRTLLAVGAALLSAGWVVASRAGDVSLLVVAYGLLLATGLQLVFVGSSTAMARRYAGVAGLALGITYAGPGIGVAIALPVVTPLVPDVGWREVSLGFAVLSVVGLPFVWLMTSGPQVVVPARPARRATDPATRPASGRTRGESGAGLHETAAPGAIGAAQEPLPAGSRTRVEGLRRTLRTRRFWILLLGAVGIGCIDEGVFQLFQPHAVLQGIDRDVAAQALSVQSLTYVVGQVVGGGLSDRFGRRYVGLLVAALIFFGATGAFAATGSTIPIAFAGNAVYGFGIGATIAIRSAAFSDVFGGRDFGAIFGIIAIAYPAGGIVVMQSGAAFYDALHSYWPVYWIAMTALVAWSAALFVAGPRRHGLRARLSSVRARLPG